MRNSQRLRLPIALLLLVFSFASAAIGAEKKVLFIHTSKSSGPVINVYDRALQAALSEDTRQQITLYHEYTDLWLFEGEDYARTLHEFYRQKYTGLHPDLILVESAPALKFLLAYGDELFPGTPVVLCIMEGTLIEGLTLKSNFTGVLAGVDFKNLLRVR